MFIMVCFLSMAKLVQVLFEQMFSDFVAASVVISTGGKQLPKI